MDNRSLCYKVSDWQSSDRNVMFDLRRCHEDGSIHKGYFATKEEAETAWRIKKSAIAEEYKKLRTAAMKLLEEREAYLLEVFTSLDVEVSTDASAWDDSGLDSWLCLSTSVKGEEGIHYYELKVRL